MTGPSFPWDVRGASKDHESAEGTRTAKIQDPDDYYDDSGWFGVSCVKAWLFTLSRLYYRWTFIRVLLSSLEAAAAELIIFHFSKSDA